VVALIAVAIVWGAFACVELERNKQEEYKVYSAYLSEGLLTDAYDWSTHAQSATAPVVTTTAYPAETGAFPKEENLYFKALSASIIEMEKSYGHLDLSYLGVRTDYHHMLVEQDPTITKDLPEQFGDRRVEYLDTQDVVAKCKQMRKPFSILKIFPIENDGPRLKITINVYWASYKKGHLELALSDWSEVELHYSCEKRSFLVSNVKLGGV